MTNQSSGPDSDREPAGTLELRDAIIVETQDGKQLKFEVVGLVEDDDANSFAVCYCEEVDEFIVTDMDGTMLGDDKLAQEILDDFFVLAQESSDES